MSVGENRKTLNALIRLLDEPDEKVYQTIRNKILSMGTTALEILQENEYNLRTPEMNHRLEEIMETIRINDTRQKLENWRETKSHDLLEAWVMLSNYLAPDDNLTKQKASVNKLYRDIWIEMNPELTALEKIRVVNHVFYRVYQYDALQGEKAVLPPYLLGNVLRMQRGNPLTLAMLYLIVTQKLGMPVFGVNLPRHLILAFTNGSALPRPASDITEKEILFYINPFNQGAVFRKSEIILYLKQLNMKPQDKFFLPCTNTDIIKRWIRETLLLVRKGPHTERAAALEIFLSVLE